MHHRVGYGLDAPQFGDVRALVQSQPSQQAWWWLSTLLDRWPDHNERRDVVVPYVQQSIAHWPERIRIAPWSWLGQVIEGQHSDCFGLARHVHADKRVYRYAVKRLLWRKEMLHIRQITLSDNDLDARVMNRVMLAPSMQMLSGLVIEQQRLRSTTLEALQHLERCRSLRAFGLSQVGLTAMNINTLRRSASMLLRLHDLSLSRNLIGPEGFAHFLSFGPWTSLQTLNIANCHLDDDGLFTLCHTSRLPALTSLDISGNGLGDLDGLRALGQSSLVDQLSTLHLGVNFWRARALALELREWSPKQLTTLSVPSVGFGPGDMSLWATIGWLSQLQHLDLSFNGLGDVGIGALFEQVCFERLACLKLCSVNLTDETIEHIGQVAQMPALHTLHLERNRLSGAGLEALLEKLPSIRRVYCQGNPLSVLAMKMLAKNTSLDMDIRLYWADQLGRNT